MKTYISMLRGINVSGQKKIKMEELKKIYESLGLLDVTTYIQSGNVLFRSSETNIIKLRSKIQNRIKQSLGFQVTVIIRTTHELKRVIESTPFLNKDTSKLHFVFLAYLPAIEPKEEINKVIAKNEEFLISGKEIYLFCPNGYGKTKLSNNLFERKLGVSATTRNWKTVNKLFDIASGLDKQE